MMGDEALPAFENCQGNEATVCAGNGKIRFYWKHPSGRVIAFMIPGSPKWTPKEKGEKRFISFTPYGLNLLDNFENVMLSPRATQPPTWTINEMKKFEQCDDMRVCWEKHTGEVWRSDKEDPPLEGDYAALPKSFFEPKGPPPLGAKQADVAAYAQPPKSGDGTWIIHEFLKGFIGDDGGRLLTGNVEMLAKYSSEHVLVQLKSFLTQPKYMHYPWRSDWLGIVDPNTRKLWGRLRRNVVFCRDIVKESKLSIPAKETADGKPKHGTWWEIGPKKEGW